MGCGKSTIGKRLERLTGHELIEMDDTIESQQSMKIAQIFEQFGEDGFRRMETGLIEEISGRGGCIVSCGGGAVLRAENVALMKNNGVIVLLETTPEVIYERVKDSYARPLLNGHMSVEYIRELMEKRNAAYLAAADYVVDADKTPGRIALEIAELLHDELEA